MVTSMHAQADMELRVPRTIHITTDPESVLVIYRDSILGRTPLDVPLSFGKVRLRSAEINEWGGGEREIDVSPMRSMQGIMRVVMPKKMSIETIPFGAQVWIGDSLAGTTPFSFYLDAENVTLTIDKFNYRRDTLRLTRSSPDRNLVLLDKIDHAIPHHSILDYTSNFRFPRSEVLLTGTLGFASGIASILLKRHADDLYEHYRSSYDASSLSQSRRYDLYAGAALVLLELSLGYLVYTLLF